MKAAVANELYLAWLKHPEQRLGQLVMNLAGSPMDVCHIEDDELAEAARRGLKEKAE